MERFFTLIKLAWRNLGRQKRRTFISVGAVGFGLAIALFFLTLGDGIYAKLMEDAVRTNGGNFSFEHPDYRDAPAIDLFVSDIETKRKQLETMDEETNSLSIPEPESESKEMVSMTKISFLVEQADVRMDELQLFGKHFTRFF